MATPQHQAGQEQPVVMITITMTEAGVVNVTGPIENKMACYGLLEIAKEVVREHCEKIQRQQRITPASVGDIAAVAAAGLKKGS